MKKVKLSPAQVKFLAHRLEVADAIADALDDSEDVHYTFDECLEAGLRLLPRVESGEVWCESEVERLVLADAVNGSTYFAVCEGHGEYSEFQLCNVERTIEATAKKIGEYLGEELTVVTW